MFNTTCRKKPGLGRDGALPSGGAAPVLGDERSEVAPGGVRRRGVGQYLVEETLRDNPAINSWRVADHGVEDRGVMAAFMQVLGFSAQQNGWEKH